MSVIWAFMSYFWDYYHRILDHSLAMGPDLTEKNKNRLFVE